MYWKYTLAMPDDGHRTRLLNRLSSAISRCHNPKNAQFRAYGGRGIHVYQEWRDDRTAFLRYVQTCEGWDNPALEMDREDNSGGYVPGNIRFLSRRENLQNVRRIHVLEAEIQRLRRVICRQQEQIHDLKQRGAFDRP